MSQSDKMRVLTEGKHLRLVARGQWEFVERTRAAGAVVIIAVTDEKKLLLVEQERPPLGRRVIELPAGLVGDIAGEENEAWANAARRELLEETGYEARELHLETSGPPSPGMASEIVSLFTATGLRRVSDGGGDHSEDIEIHEVALAEADRWLNEQMQLGKLIDPKVYAGMHFALVREARR